MNIYESRLTNLRADKGSAEGPSHARCGACSFDVFAHACNRVCVCVRFGNAAPSCQKPAEEANVLRHKTFHKTLSLLGG